MTEGRGAGQVLGARGACVGRAGGSWAQQALGAGRAGALQVSGARGKRAGDRCARDRRAGRARQGAAAGAGVRGAGLAGRPGRAGWPWAVHSVHSACFWPGSTRYFS